MSTVSSYGLDMWFNRHLGFKQWACTVIEDTACLRLGRTTQHTAKKDEDLVVVDAEEEINGESVQREMDQERRLQRTRAWLAGIALSMGIVGLWGDKR